MFCSDVHKLATSLQPRFDLSFEALWLSSTAWQFCVLNSSMIPCLLPIPTLSPFQAPEAELTGAK